MNQEENAIKRFSLRIPSEKVEIIDQLRKERPVRVSRNHWLLEAIEEKLTREQHQPQDRSY